MRKILLLLLISILCAGCKNTSKVDLPISNDIIISNIHVEESYILHYTIKNNSKSHYGLYDENIEYFDGKSYQPTKEKKSRKAINKIIKGGETLELTIDLNEKYYIEKDGAYRIVIFLHNNESDNNEKAVRDFKLN